MQHNEEEFSFNRLFFPLTTFKVAHFIVIIGIIVYSNSLFNGFVGDDIEQIINNPFIHSLANIPQLFLRSTFEFGGVSHAGLYYKPFLSSMFTLLYSVAGPNAFLYHLFHVLLHIVNTILVLLIFRRFFNIYISTFLSLLFLVHPINAESVAYISNLQDVLVFFFGVLALYLAIRLKNNLTQVSVISVLLLCSLFSKETGVLFMAAVFLYVFLFNKKMSKTILIADAAVLVLYIFFRFALAQVFFGTDSSSPIMSASVGTRLLTLPAIWWYYIKTSFFPLNLAVNQVWLITQKNIAEFYSTSFYNIVFIAIIISIGFTIYTKNRNAFRTFVFFLLLLGIGLIFHSQLFFTLDLTVADRWFYFPLVGLLGVIGLAMKLTPKRFAIPKIFLLMSVIAIISLMSVRTHIRNSDFYDNYTLASHDIRYSPDSSLLANLLGNELMNRGQYKEAEHYLVRAVQLDPKGQVVWNSLGVYYDATWQLQKAQHAYRNAIKISPYYMEAYFNLALSLLFDGRLQSAESTLKDALGYFPTNGRIWQIYSVVEYKLGHSAIALDAAKQAATYFPTTSTVNTYNSLSQNLPINIKIDQSYGTMNRLKICAPDCI